MSKTTPYQKPLTIWFGQKGSPEYLRPKPFWYGSATSDAYVRKTLSAEYEAAQSGALDPWMHDGQAEGALSLIILLDQVPRNIFWDTPRAYATDAKALDVARYAISRGWDKTLPGIQRRYMYSPFNHSEDLRDQEVSVKLFTELGDEEHLYWARRFYEQIKRDGRFVHRDWILGR
ncbi:hypothetical protein BDV25DRAFT_135039 [Aspergillus avenaceus]|uniref:DUF924-domain-containing protein n=1 Tax=Aspergillus avenaceus TaxID=36643 RepID=A0A5N6U9K8_ASPAV|nr:hypothetical protein BDV25DRAFT_135039 [Aspergillus avenaceus]